jgi:Na+/melibiose symporter-like transporter
MTLSHLQTLAELIGLLIVAGTLVFLAIRMRQNRTYKVALGISLMTALLVLWINLAVGIIGEPDNLANLMYVGVLVVGIVGAIIARFQPLQMAIALFATAVAQILVASITAILRLGFPPTPSQSLLILNAVLIGLWVGSALLFRKAAREQNGADAIPER